MPPRQSDTLDALLYIKNFEGIWEKFSVSSLEITRKITSFCDALKPYQTRIQAEGTLEMVLDKDSGEFIKTVLENDPEKDWEDMILKGLKK